MKKISIFFWITFIFLLAFIGIGASYFLALKYITASSHMRIEKRYEFISQTLVWQLSKIKDFNRLASDLKKIDMLPITHPKEALAIVKNAKVLRRKLYPFGDAALLRYGNDHYIWIRSLGNALLIKDLSEDELGRLLYTAIFVAMLIVLFLVYVLVILKLRPLKQITQEIEKFSRGDLDLKLDIKSSKEIHEVASALQNAAKSLQCIQNSRKLLLRNIMHELKTPITKGRIAAEMIEDPRQRQRLVQIFGKLNSLINEFAALEAVNSKIKPNFEELRVLDILDEAINIGMFDKSEIRVVRRADPKVKADYRLMAIAFKNLLDNALKYAHSHPVEVVVEAERILFKNSGEPLKKELAHYTEPFTKEHPQSGFGLGLYLVASILKLHNFHLSYHHTQGHNLFAIHFPSQKEESRE